MDHGEADTTGTVPCRCIGGSTHATANPAVRLCDLCGGIVRTNPSTGEFVSSEDAEPVQQTPGTSGHILHASITLRVGPTYRHARAIRSHLNIL